MLRQRAAAANAANAANASSSENNDLFHVQQGQGENEVEGKFESETGTREGNLSPLDSTTQTHFFVTTEREIENVQERPVLTERAWRLVLQRMLARHEADAECAICMGTFIRSSSSSSSSSSSRRFTAAHRHMSTRRLTLLSCSHCFHTPCIEALERFIGPTKTCRCPVCRAVYDSCLLTPDGSSIDFRPRPVPPAPPNPNSSMTRRLGYTRK
jgi:hypothetical protein